VNPTDILGPAVGGLAVFMIFAVPIISIIAVMVIILTLSTKRHRERMKMIEQGLVPAPPRKNGRSYALLGWGAVLLAFGLALTVGMLASGDADDLTGGLIFGFIGLAMIAVFLIISNQRKHEPPPNGSDGKSIQPPQD
jgi:preprotein translocase subunit YajC